MVKVGAKNTVHPAGADPHDESFEAPQRAQGADCNNLPCREAEEGYRTGNLIQMRRLDRLFKKGIRHSNPLQYDSDAELEIEGMACKPSMREFLTVGEARRKVYLLLK
jgi:hypothetical protein